MAAICVFDCDCPGSASVPGRGHANLAETTQVYGTLPVANGGSGAATFTIHGILFGETTSAFNVSSAGASGQPMLSGGSSSDPNWGTLGANYGGTGNTSLTAYSVMIGNGTGAVQFATPTGNSQCFQSAASSGTTTNPIFGACPSAPNFSISETPSGALTGTSFTLAHTPVSGSLQLYLNGVRLAAGGSADYTLATATITMANAPGSSTTSFLADYRY